MSVKRNPAMKSPLEPSSSRNRSVRFEDDLRWQETDFGGKHYPATAISTPTLFSNGKTKPTGTFTSSSSINYPSLPQVDSMFPRNRRGSRSSGPSQAPANGTVTTITTPNLAPAIPDVSFDAQLPPSYRWNPNRNPMTDASFEWASVPQVLRFLPEPSNSTSASMRVSTNSRLNIDSGTNNGTSTSAKIDKTTTSIDERLRRIEQHLQCQRCFWYWFPQRLCEMTGLSALWRKMTGQPAATRAQPRARTCASCGQRRHNASKDVPAAIVHQRGAWTWKKIVLLTLSTLALATIIALGYVAFTLKRLPYDEVPYVPQILHVARLYALYMFSRVYGWLGDGYRKMIGWVALLGGAVGLARSD